MKKYTATGIIAALSFIWSGMIIAISFLEAWLKFRAPGITLSLGLGIGRLVFSVLNAVEWVFCAAIIFILFVLRAAKVQKLYWPFCTCIILLLLQSLWLLPALNTRAELYIQNMPVPSSFDHFYYGIAEVLKCVMLLATGIRSLQIIIKQQ